LSTSVNPSRSEPDSLSTSTPTETSNRSSKTPTMSTFYTPCNEEFYNSYEYSNQDSSKFEIRLLELFPADENEFLEGNLTNCFLSDISHPGYQAILYCAGDPSETTRILINGTIFNLFASVGTALTRIRQTKEAAGNKAEHRQLLWIDQICINQSNRSERSSQVTLMRVVYENANQSLIWLGDGPFTRGLALLEHYSDILIKIETEMEGQATDEDTEIPRRFAGCLQNCLQRSNVCLKVMT
jgi:hypothetical protein